MCGGRYGWQKQLAEIKGEPIVARTIRLLKEAGIEDIAISSNDPIFEQFGVPVLHHKNDFLNGSLYWVDAFYPIEEPVCYLFGDVVYSPNAISVITETDTDDVMFFASAPPFTPEYIKPWAEPFAFKVVNTKHFRNCVEICKMWQDGGYFRRVPIAWELWQVIKETPINKIDYTNYTVINDYTCDVDCEADLAKFNFLKE